jgi:hypothetical protein
MAEGGGKMAVVRGKKGLRTWVHMSVIGKRENASVKGHNLAQKAPLVEDAKGAWLIGPEKEVEAYGGGMG